MFISFIFQFWGPSWPSFLGYLATFARLCWVPHGHPQSTRGFASSDWPQGWEVAFLVVSSAGGLGIHLEDFPWFPMPRLIRSMKNNLVPSLWQLFSFSRMLSTTCKVGRSRYLHFFAQLSKHIAWGLSAGPRPQGTTRAHRTLNGAFLLPRCQRRDIVVQANIFTAVWL